MSIQIQEKKFSAFLPVTLVALSSCILMSWNLLILVNQHSDSLMLIGRQDVQMAQASQAEAKLTQMMTDLVNLAKEDADAATIVKRHGIKFNPPANSPMTLFPKTPAKALPKAMEKEAAKVTPKALNEIAPAEKPVETPAAPATTGETAKPSVDKSADK